MAKTNKTFSLDVELAALLSAAAQERGQTMSLLVENGIRALLAMPLPDAEDADERTLGPTRTQLDVMDVMTRLGAVGWHSSLVLAKESGASHNLTEKALKQLRIAGKVFLWGDGCADQDIDGLMARETRWGLRDPLEIVRSWVAKWQADGKTPDAREAAIVALRKMLLGASLEICGQCAEIIEEATGCDASALGFDELTRSDRILAEGKRQLAARMKE